MEFPGVITRNSAVSPDMSLLAAEQHCPMSLLAAMRFYLMSLLATARYCLILIFKDTAFKIRETQAFCFVISLGLLTI
jgi:hypothetical protein